MEYFVIITNAGLVVSTLFLVIVTATLVRVTWKYVEHSKRMADIMLKDYETRNSPVIYINEENHTLDFNNFESRIELINKGSVVANIGMVSFWVYLVNNPSIDQLIYQELSPIQLMPYEEAKASFVIKVKKDELRNPQLKDPDNRLYHEIKLRLDYELAGPTNDFMKNSHEIF